VYIGTFGSGASYDRRVPYAYVRMYIGGVIFSPSEAIEPIGGYRPTRPTTVSLTLGPCDCDRRPTVTFPAVEHCHCPLGRYSFPISLRLGG